MIHWRPETPAPSLSWIVGRATLTTRLSSIGMNRPNTMATSTSHLRRSLVSDWAVAGRSIVLAITSPFAFARDASRSYPRSVQRMSECSLILPRFRFAVMRTERPLWVVRIRVQDGNGHTAASGQRTVALSHRQIMVVYSGLMAGLLVAALDQTIVATALPTIVGDLGGLNHLSWVVTAYLLTSTVSVPLYGKVSDLLGRRIVFQAAIVIFVAGSILAGLSQNMLELVLFRALQGAGGGGLIAMAQAIIGDIVAPRERGRYQGYLGAVFAFASVVGPLLGGWFVDHLTWRWVFYVNVPVGAIALVITSAVLNVRFRRIEHAIDFLGAALVTGSATCLLLVTVWGGGQYDWTSPMIVGLAVAGVALLGLFVVQEGRAAEPVIPLRLWRTPC